MEEGDKFGGSVWFRFRQLVLEVSHKGLHVFVSRFIKSIMYQWLSEKFLRTFLDFMFHTVVLGKRVMVKTNPRDLETIATLRKVVLQYSSNPLDPSSGYWLCVCPITRNASQAPSELPQPVKFIWKEKFGSLDVIWIRCNWRNRCRPIELQSNKCCPMVLPNFQESVDSSRSIRLLSEPIIVHKIISRRIGGYGMLDEEQKQNLFPFSGWPLTRFAAR